MESIEKVSLVDKNKLSGEFYFTSLLEEACCHGLLSEAAIEKIQLECFELLAYKTERYTSGESSSVPVELAKSIMKSNLYTVGLYLKSFPSPDDAIEILKEQSIDNVYICGRKAIDKKLKAARRYHAMAISNLIKTDNYTYRSTIVDGIKGFFKIYNADFEAHEIHITANYPLCNPIADLVGIEFILKYLESIYYENMFCKYFAPDAVEHLLRGYDKQYQDLIFNLFEQVLTCALGCALVKSDITTLRLSAVGVEQIYSLLSGKAINETEDIIVDAYRLLIEKFALTGIQLQRYIEKALPKIVSNVFNAVKADKLETVFIRPQYPEANPHITFSFGDKMDDGKYRDIVNEIVQCRFSSDKVAMIRNNIKSLDDLDDLFFDAEMTAGEITAVLKELSDAEIAALAKRHPKNGGMQSVDLDNTELAFRLCLDDYILSLPRKKQNVISNIINVTV